MDLIVAIVGDEDAGRVTEALAGRGYKSTRINTASGFLKMRNTTLLIGVESDQVDEVLGIIRANCRPHVELVPPVPISKHLGPRPSRWKQNRLRSGERWFSFWASSGSRSYEGASEDVSSGLSGCRPRD